MKGLIKELIAKFYSFLYFSFWGFYYGAGYLFCTKNIIL